MVIRKDSDKKSNKNHNKSYPSECEHIEDLIIYSGKITINPGNTPNIEEHLENECIPKYSLVNMIEYNEECEIDERKNEHRAIIWS